jgi:hypothetical protein
MVLLNDIHTCNPIVTLSNSLIGQTNTEQITVFINLISQVYEVYQIYVVYQVYQVFKQQSHYLFLNMI